MLTERQRAVLCTALFFFFASFLSACNSSPKDHLKELATNSSLNQSLVFQTSTFNLLGFANNKKTSHVNIYIEGDGQAFEDPWTVSRDSSPADPVGFRLALVDSRKPSTLYLARPCQFIMDKRCTALDWTSRRFGPPILEAYSQALNQLKKSWGVKTFTLHGYSGGATIALLLAANRDDITSIVTFAPLLDPEKWIQFHNYSPLSGSLSPLTHAHRLSSIAQEHFIGLEDTDVPLEVAENYFAALPESSTNIVHKIPSFSHHSDWPSVWKSYILKTMK